MDYKLISVLVGAGYDNPTIDKIISAVQQMPPLNQQVPVQQVQQVPVQQVPQVQQGQVPQVQVPQVPQVQAPQVQVPQVQQVPAVPQVQVPPVQQVPAVPQVQVPQVQVPQVQVPQVQQVQVPQGQVPQADVNADLSHRMLTLMRDMQTAAGFSGNLNNASNPPKSAEDVSLDILNAGGVISGN